MTKSRFLRIAFIALAGVAITGLAWGLRQWWHARALRQPIPAELVEIAPTRLAQPDALIVSSRLSQLPRDLLAVPALRAALSEDFVFYYEQNEGLLGLKGSLRRIAYEHELSLRDEVIALLLDQPADVALWRGTDGRLQHWMLNASRTEWVGVLELAAKAASNDAQLSEVGRLPLLEGGDTPLYKLQFTTARSLLFAGHGDKVLVLSDDSLVDDAAFGSKDDNAAVWKALLDSRWKASPLRRHFGLAEFSGKHALVIDAAVISFNYQQLFPEVEALRFDFDGSDWESYARLAANPKLDDTLDTRALWRLAPADAALCAAAPIRWQPLADVFASSTTAAEKPTALFDALGGPAGICWYADAGLYQPLLFVPIRKGASHRDALANLFDYSLGNSHGDNTGAVETEQVGTATVWRRDIATDFGEHRVALALREDWLIFSPDAGLVDNALAVLAKQRPALADRLPDGAHTATVIAPAALSGLLARAVEGDLPAEREPLFHEAAQRLLLPRLQALGKFPPYAVSLPHALDASRRAWQPLTWQRLSGAP